MNHICNSSAVRTGGWLSPGIHWPVSLAELESVSSSLNETICLKKSSHLT